MLHIMLRRHGFENRRVPTATIRMIVLGSAVMLALGIALRLS
ncbi:hypothetical protein [Croceicoccus naphthovorans]|nr:hypothetical protein [Croceicoccus naphthovorans]MBB3989815.1 hypothetical protein [Croceicoccus naphthovorans]